MIITSLKVSKDNELGFLKDNKEFKELLKTI